MRTRLLLGLLLLTPRPALAASAAPSPRDAFLLGQETSADAKTLAEVEHACETGAAGPCGLPIGPLACRRLGEMYHDRDSTASSEKAKAFFRRAATAGDAVAAYRLSLMLDEPKDAAAADALLRQACDEKKNLGGSPAPGGPRLFAWPPSGLECGTAPASARAVRVIGDPEHYRAEVDEACGFLARQADEAALPGGPVRVGGDVKEPRKIRHVDPVYPPEAEEARVEGTVILEITVDRAGLVADIKVLRSIPPLDAAATHAVGEWVFEPTVLKGSLVPVVFTTAVTFRLAETKKR